MFIRDCIYAPPLILYFKGILQAADFNSIAIVGTRNPTHYGKKHSENFAKEMALNSVSVISGMARGIDTIAHKSTLSKKGRTIAVLGSGLDVVYPYENKRLFEEITENGAVISEYPLSTQPDAQNFPKRNRIISGLSLGTLVIESGIKGGAIQTARLALEQNREVFAVPGNLGVQQSEGTNLLIQKGEAKLVKTAEDIFVELNMKIQPEIGKNIPKPTENLNFFEQNLFDLITDQPQHIDKISHKANLGAGDCLVHLLSLEFRDLIKQLPGKNFVRN
jgi:DNA processing protein